MDLKAMPKDERLYRMRHSAAHIMAEAVLEMFPEAKFAIGPPIDSGFYYDFELPRALTPEDLPEIEQRMRARMKSNVPFEHSEMSKDEALRQRLRPGRVADSGGKERARLVRAPATDPANTTREPRPERRRRSGR